MRSARVIGAITVALTSLAGAGCGTSLRPPPKAATPSGSVDPVTSAPRLSAAVAYARIVNLRASDLPASARRAPSGLRSRRSKQSREFARCVGTHSAHGIVGARESPAFTVQTDTAYALFESAVTVTSSSSDAARVSAVWHRVAVMRHCLARDFRSSLSGEKAADRVGHIAATALTNPLQALPDSFGYRVAIAIRSAPSEMDAANRRKPRATSASTRVYVDVLGFRSGKAIVVLIVESYPLPISPKEEHHLLARLYTRASADGPHRDCEEAGFSAQGGREGLCPDAGAGPNSDGEPARVSEFALKDGEAAKLAEAALVDAESYAKVHHRTYEGLTPLVLHRHDLALKIGPGSRKAYLSSAIAIEDGEGFEVGTTAVSGHQFSVVRRANGTVERRCTPTHVTGKLGGACQNGTW